MRLVQLTAMVLTMVVSFNTHAFEWRNLWSTPEQRAAKNLEAGDYDTLVQEAPSAAWQGVGQYRQGDFEAASESFAKQHEQAVAAGSTPDAVSAQYNRANAEVLAGNYDQALNLYDEVLELDPEHEDAKHNAEIAKQLWKQQQEQQQQEGEGQGQQQDGEQQDGEQQQSESGQQQQDQSQNEQRQNNQSSNQSGNQQQNGDQQDSQNMEQASAESQQDEDQKAAEAMQAERDKQQNAQLDDAHDQQGNESANTGNQLTEQEQATEQWLRQIPDDPAGLLQRKLQNRHMTDYPEVRNSAKPW